MSKNLIEMPQRQHYLKFQCSIPSGGKNQEARRQKVIDAAAAHLKALAGGAATNVEVRAVYAERGERNNMLAKWDILVVLGFDGPLNETTKKMKIERNVFELDKRDAAFDNAIGAAGKVLKS